MTVCTIRASDGSDDFQAIVGVDLKPCGTYTSRLMSASLPDRLDADRAIAARRSFQGELPLAAMPRLAATLADGRGTVEYELDFGIEALHTRCLALRAKAVLALECQRTLEVFDYPVAVDVRLGLIDHERDEAGLPEGMEPLLLDDGELRPAQVIEDELLLALPAYPVKPGADAETKSWDGKHWVAASANDEAEPAQNPFAVLGELKKHNH